MSPNDRIGIRTLHIRWIKMIEIYSDFMVFGLKDTGEQHRLDVSEEDFRQNNGSHILRPLQVREFHPYL